MTDSSSPWFPHAPKDAPLTHEQRAVRLEAITTRLKAIGQLTEWVIDETDAYWILRSRYFPYQILKARKEDDRYTPYWPTEPFAQVLVNAPLDVGFLLEEVGRLQATINATEVFKRLGETWRPPERDVAELQTELAGARSTIYHLTTAMSWVSGHDRQGLDHLKQAEYLERAKKHVAEQAKLWKLRAQRADFRYEAQFKRYERAIDRIGEARTEARNLRRQLKEIEQVFDETNDELQGYEETNKALTRQINQYNELLDLYERRLESTRDQVRAAVQAKIGGLLPGNLGVEFTSEVADSALDAVIAALRREAP